VDRDYYLVTSSFEYFPGVPLFHSKDLIHWRHLGHCLTRPEQLPLHQTQSSLGIWAPTIRYHDDTFYMVTTNMSGKGHFYVTASDPSGPWSDPIWLDYPGIDPSLFFDDTGTVYFTFNQKGAIYQSELDRTQQRLVTEPRLVWNGTGGMAPEGPHLYKINGTYYFMIAEGGTEFGHMQTIARSSAPYGPFEPDPKNPILSHRDRALHPIQALGHADLVEDHQGNWWMVFLGIRPVGHYPPCHHLGRETFLAPVTWTNDGWLQVNKTGTVELSMHTDTLPSHSWEPVPAIDSFDTAELMPYWNFIRNPVSESWSLTDRPGWLRLNGLSQSLHDPDSPAFVCRRQQHFCARVKTRMDFTPHQPNEEAGLAVYMNEKHHVEFGIRGEDGKTTVLFLRIRIGDLIVTTHEIPTPGNPIVLSITSDTDHYFFGYEKADGSYESIGTAQTRYLSKEVAGGFTGVYWGMYATGNGIKNSGPADFQWFSYELVE